MNCVKKLRECLPSPEREEYVLESRRAGCTFVTERQRNRYIDEFLRFCLEQAHHASARKVTTADLRAFGKHVARSCRKVQTARTKVTIVLAWCRWLLEKGYVKQDPGEGLRSTDLVPVKKG